MARGIHSFLNEYQRLLEDPDAIGRAFDAQASVVDRLEADQARIGAELKRVEAELATEQRRLELLSMLMADHDVSDKDRLVESRPLVMQALGRALSSRGPVGIRLEVVDVMRARRDGPWTPAELEETLSARGVETSRSNLQSTLANMVKDQQIVRLRRGAYRLGDNLLEEVDRITREALARPRAL